MIKITIQNTAVLSAKMDGDIRPEVMALVYYLYNNDQENYRKFVDTVNNAVMIIDMENDYHAEDKEERRMKEPKPQDLIRCKDCLYWTKPVGWTGWCEHGIPAEEDDFCSWGERKERKEK